MVAVATSCLSGRTVFCKNVQKRLLVLRLLLLQTHPKSAAPVYARIAGFFRIVGCRIILKYIHYVVRLAIKERKSFPPFLNARSLSLARQCV